MKKKLLYLALAISLPCTVFAGANKVMAEFGKLKVVRANDRERVVDQHYYNYRLVWNPELMTFEVHDGEQHTPLNLNAEEQITLPQKETTPHYYREELSI